MTLWPRKREMFLIAFYALAIISATFLPFEAIEPLALILVPGIALLATGIFPCMTLIVGSMKPDGRSPKRISELYENFQEILRLLVIAFICAAGSIFMIMASVAMDYTQILHDTFWRRVTLAAAIIAVVALGAHISSVIRVFFAILALNNKQSLLVARENNRKFFVQARKDARLPSDNYASKERRQLKKVE